jgi:hypothetical protein
MSTVRVSVDVGLPPQRPRKPKEDETRATS